MKRLKDIYLLVLTFLVGILVIGSCTEDNPVINKDGYLNINISKDESTILVDTRSSDRNLPSLAFRNLETSKVRIINNYSSANTPKIKLPAGLYRITALYGTVFNEDKLQKSSSKTVYTNGLRNNSSNNGGLNAAEPEIGVAAWNTPIYMGTSDVNIPEEKEVTANLICTLANTKVSVAFEEDIDRFFKNYQVVVSNGDAQLVFSKDADNLKDTAYFSVTNKLSWYISMENNDGDVYTSETVTYTDVAAAQHYNLKFRLEGETSDASGIFKIVVNDSVNEVEHNMNFDLREDALPAIESNFALEGDLQVMQGAIKDYSLKYIAEKGIANLILSHKSKELAEAGLPYYVDIIEATQDKLAQLASVGIKIEILPAIQEEGTLVQNESTIQENAVYSKLVKVDLSNFLINLDLGKYAFSMTLIDATDHYDQKEFAFDVVSPVEAIGISTNSWTYFSFLNAQIFTETLPEGLKFQYRPVVKTGTVDGSEIGAIDGSIATVSKSGGKEWNDVEGEIAFDSEKKIATIRLNNLLAETEYEFRTTTTTNPETEPLKFITQKEETVYNLDFDHWYANGSCWYPNAEGHQNSLNKRTWDTANPGTSSFGTIPTTPEDVDVAVKGEGKRAARLETMTTFGILSAGNIYTGQFAGLAGMGAKLDWGEPFTSRPIAMKGYYKYMPKPIDYVCKDSNYKDKFAHLKGEPDQGYIRIMITDWEQQFRAVSSSYIYVEDDNPGIIAEGGLVLGDSEGEYKEFIIPLKYRDLERLPNFIFISGAASRFGDYATGGKGSVLLLDEFSLVYDPDELTPEQRAEVGL